MGQGVLEAIPAQEAGYTLDRSPVHHRVNRERERERDNYSQDYSQRLRKDICQFSQNWTSQEIRHMVRLQNNPRATSQILQT